MIEKIKNTQDPFTAILKLQDTKLLEIGPYLKSYSIKDSLEVGAVILNNKGVIYREHDKSIVPMTCTSITKTAIDKYINATDQNSNAPVITSAHCISLLLPGYANYFHMLIDMFPRAIHYKKLYPEAKFLVSSHQLKHLDKRGLLKVFNELFKTFFSIDDMIIFDADIVKVPNAIYTYKEKKRYLIETANYFNDLSKKINISSRESVDKVYISRKNCWARRVTNENKLLPLLKKYDFECLCLEDMELASQIKIFANAKYILAPHGAGLSNLIFSGKNTTCIELLHTSGLYKSKIFGEISNIVGINHIVVETEDENMNANKKPGQFNMIVNVKKMRKLLTDIVE